MAVINSNKYAIGALRNGKIVAVAECVQANVRAEQLRTMPIAGFSFEAAESTSAAPIFWTSFRIENQRLQREFYSHLLDFRRILSTHRKYPPLCCLQTHLPGSLQTSESHYGSLKRKRAKIMQRCFLAIMQNSFRQLWEIIRSQS
jgi:hypothetical protein